MNNPKPLFHFYPTLKKQLPCIPLGSFPTPIYKLDKLSKITGFKNLYIKRDDLSGTVLKDGTLFGGNKVRKLEFLFGQALEQKFDSVITFGCVGSNHVVATAAYGHHLGLHTIAMLKPQPNSQTVQKNLCLMKFYGTDIHVFPNDKVRNAQTIELLKEYTSNSSNIPFVIPTGGSIPLGIVGFVNAAFELKQQILEESLPEPDKIYIPAGSWGSAVGLLIGKKACGLKTKLMIISVEPETHQFEHRNYLFHLFEQTNNYLHSLDTSFPLFTLTDQDFEINHNFTGYEYGLFTKEGLEAKTIMKKTEDINLDGTYTAKIVAAMLHDIKNMQNKNEIILYWHTYCSDSLNKQINEINYKDLPVSLHHYYEEPVQEFDK